MIPLTGRTAKAITGAAAVGFGTSAVGGGAVAGDLDTWISVINAVIFLIQTIAPMLRKKKDKGKKDGEEEG